MEFEFIVVTREEEKLLTIILLIFELFIVYLMRQILCVLYFLYYGCTISFDVNIEAIYE